MEVFIYKQYKIRRVDVMQRQYAYLKQRDVKILKLYLNDMKGVFFVYRFLMNFFCKLPGF